jgi:hypothetical protein
VLSATDPISGAQRPKRALVAQEFLKVEFRFVNDVSLLIGAYLRPLSATEPFLRDSVQRTVLRIGELESLKRVSKALVSALWSRLACWNDASTLIGDVVLSLVPYFSQYESYVSAFSNILPAIAACEHKDVRFLLDIGREEHGKGYESLAILPIQHLPRVELLLRELLKATPRAHPDYPHLTDALSRVSAAVLAVNEAERAAADAARLLRIWQVCRPRLPNMIAPGVRLVRDGLVEAETLRLGEDEAPVFLRQSGVLATSYTATAVHAPSRAAVSRAPLSRVLLLTTHAVVLLPSGRKAKRAGEEEGLRYTVLFSSPWQDLLLLHNQGTRELQLIAADLMVSLRFPEASNFAEWVEAAEGASSRCEASRQAVLEAHNALRSMRMGPPSVE